MNIMRGLMGLLLSSTLFASVQAGEVCYTPQGGVGMTMCTPKFKLDGSLINECPAMLGSFHLVYKKVSAGPGQRHLKIDGPVHGVINPDQTLNHILGDSRARGLIYTFGDTLVEAIPLNECLLQVKEELYVTSGTGLFTGANGRITVTGELNTCTGINEFDLELNDDQICFDEIRLDPMRVK